jgi:hypothetical protein
MYYQLLGKPKAFCPPNYRGTYRPGPGYQEQLPETAPVNRAWRQYASTWHERVQQADVALQLAAAFQGAGLALDVVRVEEVTSGPPASVAETVLGFDVAQQGWYSLLSWGLHWGEEVPAGPPPLGPLLVLVEAHFRPLLNAYGLFARWSDARFFLDVARAITALAPGTWEAPGHEDFDILRLVALQLADSPPNPEGGNGASERHPAYAASPDLR